MAVNNIPTGTELVLVMDNGTGATGNQLTKNITYKNVKYGASDEDVFAVAQGILSLQSRTIIAVQRRNTCELAEE